MCHKCYHRLCIICPRTISSQPFLPPTYLRYTKCVKGILQMGDGDSIDTGLGKRSRRSCRQGLNWKPDVVGSTFIPRPREVGKGPPTELLIYSIMYISETSHEPCVAIHSQLRTATTLANTGHERKVSKVYKYDLSVGDEQRKIRLRRSLDT